MSKITVITPTWNQAEYIADTIESVLCQTHQNLEYIIIDNCSDDGTQEIVEEYQKKDIRIRYLREKDHGQAEAINKGLRMATGEIVCWLNSDDFFFDYEVFTKVDSHFNQKSDVGVIVGDGWYCDKSKKMTEYNESDRKVPKWVLSRWYYIVQPSVFWRKTDLCLDENYHYVFDWKFFIGMFGKCQVYYSHEPYSVYRMYEDNKTGQDNAKRKLEIYLLQKELGVSRCNTAWCRYVYQIYQKSEERNKPSMKKNVDRLSRILFHLSGKRICSF